MGIREFIGSKRDQILAIAKQYGASNVRIFGSVAQGTADENSDIDFLVDLEEGRTLFDLGGLLMDLQDLLQRKIDVVTTTGLRERIKDDVLKQAVNL
jgi:predicted nucleotidyltransferase